MIKSFRKSKRLSNSLSHSSPKHSISRVPSSSVSIDMVDSVLKTPSKVIRALYDYKAQGPGELSFERGDFFHVVGEEPDSVLDSDGWYSATNPMTNQRGMVPKLYFEVFTRSRHASSQASVGGGEIEQSNPITAKLSTPAPKPSQTLYAVTLYDFRAERDDELDIVPGENLVICAHHECEWFIAKPINRLGGPGLVPVLYVKIIDVFNPHSMTAAEDEDMVATIRRFKIPTVEEWKDKTAKYQASTIPLGHISNSNPPAPIDSQFFQRNDPHKTASLNSSLTIVEASVDSYHLDQGRYQYLVVARLSNGKTRHLYRYYQDFYDLQVKLLELFPYEAGKIENSRRIIPSIPGPLINVNDSISKLRREKLDYYLRNLIALPPHISRSEEVLGLFELTNNEFDREFYDRNSKRSSKPINQQSGYQHDRLSQYLGVQAQSQSRNSNTSSLELSGRRSSSPAPAGGLDNKHSKVKVKFYYEDDIFVLLLPVNLKLNDLKIKLARRLGMGSEEEGAEDPSRVYLFLKDDYDNFMDENNIATDVLTEEQRELLFGHEIADDNRFHDVLYDKCKVVILSG